MRDLICCCCGELTRGRQWHNRDKGYGLCPRCGDWIIEEEGEESAVEMAGQRGVHWDIEETDDD